MRSCKAWIAVLIVVAVSDCHPSNEKRLYQGQMNTDISRVNQINGNDAKDGFNTVNSIERDSTQLHKNAPIVDDDLLEFLVRVADNPAEWNKIQRVLKMLGRDETGASAAREPITDQRESAAITTTTATTTTTTASQPTAAEQFAPSWPSSNWIMKLAEGMTAAAVARGVGAGGAAGPDPYDYDDGGDDDDYDGDEIEEIEEPTTAAAAQWPRPPTRAVSGHMSRYQFRRIDGRPDDGRVNGTYVAVVESDRPPRDIVYDPARQKSPKSLK